MEMGDSNDHFDPSQNNTETHQFGDMMYRYDLDVSKDSHENDTQVFETLDRKQQDAKPNSKDDTWKTLQGIVSSHCNLKSLKDEKGEKKKIGGDKDKEEQQICKQNENLKKIIKDIKSKDNEMGWSENKTELLMREDENGWSLVHKACSYGHEDVLET